MPHLPLLATIVTLASLSSACLPAPRQAVASGSLSNADPLQVLDRVTWGANASSAAAMRKQGIERYLEQQLRPQPMPRLPDGVQEQIDSLTIVRTPAPALAAQLDQQHKHFQSNSDADENVSERKAYRQELTRLGREAASRSLLLALYSPNQLQERMTWFWFNHFNVHLYKANLRTVIADYEDSAIRPHALGRFRDLLRAVVHHPAMLIYLDNVRNAKGRVNENFARELMELHTLGVEGGYTQSDVQELARILTGLGVNLAPDAPSVKPRLQGQYMRDGLFEFNPNRHDYGDKTLLGKHLTQRGLAEADEALDRLASHPSTARFLSRKLAAYFVSDAPAPALVERMAATFTHSDGDIAATLRTLFASPEFVASLGTKFKDPVHYVVSAVRLAYDDKPVLNTAPMLNWLNRMGEPLYGRQTPDGYPLLAAAWASPGQMGTRFEIAKAIGSGSAGLFTGEGPQPSERPAFPQLSNALYYQWLQNKLSRSTRATLDQAASAQEWNLFLLASPEFMNY
jgi:uncharacterized protein (DUF1800 family)